MRPERAEQHLSAHPLAGHSLAHHDVLYALAYLQNGSKASGHELLRLAAVLLVLYTEEIFEHRRNHILGMGKRTFYANLHEVLHKHCSTADNILEIEDVIIAVAEVDTTGTTTRLLQAHREHDDAAASVSHMSFFELPSAASLGALHESLTKPTDDDEQLPHHSWLKTMLNGLLLVALPMVAILHYQKGFAFSRVFVMVVVGHTSLLVIWHFVMRRNIRTAALEPHRLRARSMAILALSAFAVRALDCADLPNADRLAALALLLLDSTGEMPLSCAALS